MELNIGGKDYELRFGLKFIREMDRLHEQTVEGVTLGLGLELMSMQLELGRPTILMDVIKCATSHLKSKPSNEDIEDYIEELAIEDKLTDLFEEIKEETEQSPFLKQALRQQEK